MDLPYAIAGLIVGLVVGLTGIGGGALMTPLLVLGFGVPPVIAVGTDLLYAAITKTAGVWVHGRRGTVTWRIVVLMALGSLPAAVVTIALLARLDGPESYEALVTNTLAVALILVALLLFLKGPIQRLHQHARLAGARAAVRRWRAPLVVGGGASIGVLVTLSSVGAGALGTALLVVLYPGLRGVAIVGTELAHAVPLATVASLGHLHLGTVDFVLLGSLLVGSLPGVYLGSRLGIFLPDRILRPVLGGMLMLVGLKFAL
jgi:uncharacterized protein